MHNKKHLLQLFKERAFSFGDFVLSSGQKSNYYIDSKKAIFNAEIAYLLSEQFYEETKDLNFKALGGLETSSITLTSNLIQTYYKKGIEIEGFYIRKKAKEHGSKNLIEGDIKNGSKVVLLDDILTTGNSALLCIDELGKIGCKIQRVICIVDRGARKFIENHCEFRSIFTIKDFGV